MPRRIIAMVLSVNSLVALAPSPADAGDGAPSYLTSAISDPA